MKKIIFATGNQGKMREIREILGGLDAEILSMKEAGIDLDIIEDGDSFEANALIKAHAVFQALPEVWGEEDVIVLADDSGLEIDALNKEPGIYSARYLGEDTSYHIKNADLIRRLDGVEAADRTARFVCVIAAVGRGEPFWVRGVIEGRIGYEERGENGFGYDPIFYLPDMSRSTAELSPEEKNAISHRGKALREMVVRLSRGGL